MKLLKIISVFLLAAMLATFIGCGDKSAPAGTDPSGADPENTAAEETIAETYAVDTIEKADFEGREFKIISTNQDQRQVDVVAEEENGAILNDLVFRRNQKLEELFNVKITTADKDYGSINSMVQKAAQAGDNPYDLYMTNATAAGLASSGYLTAWNTIGAMDITKPWWDQAAISDMSIAGNSYLVTGDISPTGMLTSECILFNKRLFDARSIPYQYEKAFDGAWTIDEMINLTKDLTEDIDGDGKMSDKTDLYSFTLWCDAGTALFYGQGGTFSKKEEGDIPAIDFNVDAISSRYDKIYQLVIDNAANYSKSDHEMSFKVFNQGRAYFCDITFQKVEMFLRDMEDDYGVLPLPKYDEAQQRYQTNVSGAGTMVVLPVSVADTDVVGRLIDAYAAIAYDDITPSLFDVIASVKNTRDEESIRMVQLIIRNRVFDPVRMYYIAGHNSVDDLLAKPSPDIASTLAKYQDKAVAELQKIVDAVTANN